MILKILLIVFLVYYLINLVVRLFGGHNLLRNKTDWMQHKAQQHYGGQQDTEVEEGETVIDKKPAKPKKSNNNIGEYVDFEEID
ncbi:MAG: DUF4834 family protein [Tenacibaculum sp.]